MKDKEDRIRRRSAILLDLLSEIRRYCEDCDINIHDLATTTNIDYESLRQMMTGHRNITLAKLETVLGALNLEFNYELKPKKKVKLKTRSKNVSRIKYGNRIYNYSW